jgi:transcriptional regulator with XRE-family HTH domain
MQFAITHVAKNRKVRHRFGKTLATVREVFAVNLQKLIKESGLTQIEFAARLGVGPTIVSRWKTGRFLPEPRYIDKIAEEFNVSVSSLFAEPGETVPISGQSLDILIKSLAEYRGYKLVKDK